ncbi:MAG: hypothetical protein ACXWUB_10265 [Burkholderiales bacterium]
MNRYKKFALLTSVALVAAACAGTETQDRAGNPMTFFVTSANPGKGADLGGIVGADQHCEALAQSVGAGGRLWRAYLSTSATGGQAVNARDRIGNGPWQNSKGVVIARSVDDLHSPKNNLNKQTALTEKSDIVPGRGDPVNQHDILTGSLPDGRAILDKDLTCGNWTQGGAGSAMVGHHDRMGLRDDEPSRSWNSSHPSKGCSMENLRSTGGAGQFYCFAAQ